MTIPTYKSGVVIIVETQMVALLVLVVAIRFFQIRRHIKKTGTANTINII